MPKVTFDSERCKGCELCLAFCPPRVIGMDEKLNGLGYHPAKLRNEAGCTSCAACAWVCPDLVIEVYAPERSRKIG